MRYFVLLLICSVSFANESCESALDFRKATEDDYNISLPYYSSLTQDAIYLASGVDVRHVLRTYPKATNYHLVDFGGTGHVGSVNAWVEGVKGKIKNSPGIKNVEITDLGFVNKFSKEALEDGRILYKRYRKFIKKGTLTFEPVRIKFSFNGETKHVLLHLIDFDETNAVKQMLNKYVDKVSGVMHIGSEFPENNNIDLFLEKIVKGGSFIYYEFFNIDKFDGLWPYGDGIKGFDLDIIEPLDGENLRQLKKDYGRTWKIYLNIKR